MADKNRVEELLAAIERNTRETADVTFNVFMAVVVVAGFLAAIGVVMLRSSMLSF